MISYILQQKHQLSNHLFHFIKKGKYLFQDLYLLYIYITPYLITNSECFLSFICIISNIHSQQLKGTFKQNKKFNNSHYFAGTQFPFKILIHKCKHVDTQRSKYMSLQVHVPYMPTFPIWSGFSRFYTLFPISRSGFQITPEIPIL